MCYTSGPILMTQGGVTQASSSFPTHHTWQSTVTTAKPGEKEEDYQNSKWSLWQRREDRDAAAFSLCDSLPKHPQDPQFHSFPTSPEVRQAQLQLLPRFVSGDVVGGRASFILGKKKISCPLAMNEVTDINFWAHLVPETSITLDRWLRGFWDRQRCREGTHPPE